MKTFSKIVSQVRRAVRYPVVLGVTAAMPFLTLTPTAQASRAGAQHNANVLFNKLQELGWNVRDSFSWGFLQKGESAIIATTLYKGATYRIVAAGCEDAYDVDIALFDENGHLIDSDHDVNPIAVADVTPAWSGTYYIKVTMYDSTANGAHYIVQYAFKQQ